MRLPVALCVVIFLQVYVQWFNAFLLMVYVGTCVH